LAFIANAVRGIGWGAFSSASSTAVALLAPPARRAEASGQFGVASTATQAFAPALGLWLLHTTGNFTLIFVLAGIAGLSALWLLTQIPRIGTGTTSFRGAFTLPRDGVSLGTFVDPPVLLASVFLLCVTLNAPVIFAFVPLHAMSLGVENISLYFLAAGATSIGSRLLFGHLLDRGSRGIWIVAGYALMIAGFVVFIFANALDIFVVAGVLNALGQSFAHPAMSAFAMDRAASGRMGKAMATYSMFFRVGEGLGAPLAGALIVHFGFAGMYVGAIVIVFTGLVLAALHWRTVGKANLHISEAAPRA
jgi:MFS family permease